MKIMESSPASVSMNAIAGRGFVGRIFSVFCALFFFPAFPLRCFSVKETASHLFTQVVLELFPDYFEMLTIRCFPVPVSEKQNHNIYNVLSTSSPRIPFTQFTFLTLLICSYWTNTRTRPQARLWCKAISQAQISDIAVRGVRMTASQSTVDCMRLPHFRGCFW